MEPKQNIVTTSILEKIQNAGSNDMLVSKNNRHYFAGTNAFNSEDTLKKFYFIVEGKIKISQLNPQTGKEQTLYLLSRGDMFDVITLLDKSEHEYVATAIEDSEVIEIPIERVRMMIKEDASFNQYFLPYLAKQMRHMEDLAVDLSLYDVYERVLHLIGRNIKKEKHTFSLRLINNLSHEEIASLVGSVRKVVNRALQRLKKEGIIEVTRKKLQLKNLQKLFEKLHF